MPPHTPPLLEPKLRICIEVPYPDRALRLSINDIWPGAPIGAMPLAAVPDPAHIRALPIATVSVPRPIAVSTTGPGTAAVIIASLAALIRAQTLTVDYDITPVRA